MRTNVSATTAAKTRGRLRRSPRFAAPTFFYHPDNDETQAYALRENLGHDRLRRPNL